MMYCRPRTLCGAMHVTHPKHDFTPSLRRSPSMHGQVGCMNSQYFNSKEKLLFSPTFARVHFTMQDLVCGMHTGATLLV